MKTRFFFLACAVVMMALPMSSCKKTTTNSYVVTFNANDGQFEGGVVTINSDPVEEGQTVTLPAKNPTREGYNFVNWYNEKDCKTVFDPKTPITAAIVVYAGWSEKVYVVENMKCTFNLPKDFNDEPEDTTFSLNCAYKYDENGRITSIETNTGIRTITTTLNHDKEGAIGLTVTCDTVSLTGSIVSTTPQNGSMEINYGEDKMKLTMNYDKEGYLDSTLLSMNMGSKHFIDNCKKKDGNYTEYIAMGDKFRYEYANSSVQNNTYAFNPQAFSFIFGYCKDPDQQEFSDIFLFAAAVGVFNTPYFETKNAMVPSKIIAEEEEIGLVVTPTPESYGITKLVMSAEYGTETVGSATIEFKYKELK